MREIVRVHHAYDPIASPVYASPAVAEALKRRRITRAGAVEIFVGKQVKVQVERFITVEQRLTS